MCSKRRNVSAEGRAVGPIDERPTRRRGAALEDTLLRAAWDELIDVGYSRLTVEAIAARASTGKQVLYRRWPNRGQIAMAAVRHVLGPIVEKVPDTGSLREDVLTVLRLMVLRARRVGLDNLRGMLADLPELDPDLLLILPGVMAAILRQAADRGEIGHAELSPRVVSLPIDLARHEAIRATWSTVDITDEAVERMLAEVVDEVYLPLVRALAGPA